MKLFDMLFEKLSAKLRADIEPVVIDRVEQSLAVAVGKSMEAQAKVNEEMLRELRAIRTGKAPRASKPNLRRVA